MPSVHRREGSKYWWAAFYLPDGRRAYRSTKQTNRAKAMAACLEFARASELGRQGRLSDIQARNVVSTIFRVANTELLKSPTAADFLTAWLAEKELTLAEGSVPEYTHAAKGFIAQLGAKATRPVDAVTVTDALALRSKLAARLSGGTVNKTIKLLRSAWSSAVRQGLATENIFARVEIVKAQKAHRRAFTLAELRKILDAAGTEWRGMILAGLYTGQRLSDVANLTWAQVDLAAEEIRFITRKTNRHMVIPIAAPLLKHLLAMPAADRPDTPLFPSANGVPTNTLSHHFTDLLRDIGLIRKPETHAGTGKGRSSRREVGGLSFHCLRHTATSLLKNAGVSDVVAREIIGHDSEAVSRTYTHIEGSTMREAVNRLPDVTASEANQ